MGERREVSVNSDSNLLAREGLKLIRGWDDRLAYQLVENSKQPEILRWTPKDNLERFSSIEAANQWYGRDPHVVYALARAAELAGIIWFTKKRTDNIDADYTFAIRVYELASGKGLSTEFASAALGDFDETINHHSPVWLEASVNNIVARHLYKKLGFEDVLESGDRIKMVRSNRNNIGTRERT